MTKPTNPRVEEAHLRNVGRIEWVLADLEHSWDELTPGTALRVLIALDAAYDELHAIEGPT